MIRRLRLLVLLSALAALPAGAGMGITGANTPHVHVDANTGGSELTPGFLTTNSGFLQDSPVGTAWIYPGPGDGLRGAVYHQNADDSVSPSAASQVGALHYTFKTATDNFGIHFAIRGVNDDVAIGMQTGLDNGAPPGDGTAVGWYAENHCPYILRTDETSKKFRISGAPTPCSGTVIGNYFTPTDYYTIDAGAITAAHAFTGSVSVTSTLSSTKACATGTRRSPNFCGNVSTTNTLTDGTCTDFGNITGNPMREYVANIQITAANAAGARDLVLTFYSDNACATLVDTYSFAAYEFSALADSTLIFQTKAHIKIHGSGRYAKIAETGGTGTAAQVTLKGYFD